jgi:hypothetical protein
MNYNDTIGHHLGIFLPTTTAQVYLEPKQSSSQLSAFAGPLMEEVVAATVVFVVSRMLATTTSNDNKYFIVK